MLVPLDGSELAEQVLPFAISLTDRLDLQTTLLQVCEIEQSHSFYTCRTYVERVAQDITRQLDEGKKSKARVTVASAAKITGETVTGIVPDSIILYAESHQPDIILISRHGRSGTHGILLGSVAHRVLTSVRMPVLIVHPENTRTLIHRGWPRTILVLLDGSTTSEAILPLVKDIVEVKSETEVTLFKVCEPPDLRADYPEATMPFPWEEHVERATIAARERCDNYLSVLQKQLEETGLNTTSHIKLGDRVADEILTYARESPFDLIAMTTHGQSGMGDWPFGHIADRIIHMIQSPLLLLRPPRTVSG